MEHVAIDLGGRKSQICIRNADGTFSPERAKALAEKVKAFEIKLSQGAKPGKGGVLPGGKVTAEIAAIRGIPQGQDQATCPIWAVENWKAAAKIAKGALFRVMNRHGHVLDKRLSGEAVAK